MKYVSVMFVHTAHQLLSYNQTSWRWLCFQQSADNALRLDRSPTPKTVFYFHIFWGYMA